MAGRNETETMRNSSVSDRISSRRIDMARSHVHSRRSAINVSLPMINSYVDIYQLIKSSGKISSTEK